MERNTRKVFMGVLEELLQKKSIDKISVTMVIDHCGAGRQTFYNHFKDKFDLLTCLLRFKCEMVMEREGQIRQFTPYCTSQLRNMVQYEGFYKNLIRLSGASYFTQFYQKYFIDYWKEKLGRRYGEAEEFRLACAYASSAMAQMAAVWVQEDFKYTPEQMAQTFEKNLPLLLQPYVK